MTTNNIQDKYEYASTDVAMYLVAKANENRISINITKIQKLLYITYGVYLSVYKKRLVNEHPQAWPYGPVFPTTRNNLNKIDLYSISIGSEHIKHDELSQMKDDVDLNKVIDFVLTNFGTWNAGQLSEWSHSVGSPWALTRNNSNFKWGDVIACLLYTSPSPRDRTRSRMPSSA